MVNSYAILVFSRLRDIILSNRGLGLLQRIIRESLDPVQSGAKQIYWYFHQFKLVLNHNGSVLKRDFSLPLPDFCPSNFIAFLALILEKHNPGLGQRPSLLLRAQSGNTDKGSVTFVHSQTNTRVSHKT